MQNELKNAPSWHWFVGVKEVPEGKYGRCTSFLCNNCSYRVTFTATHIPEKLPKCPACGYREWKVDLEMIRGWYCKTCKHTWVGYPSIYCPNCGSADITEDEED